MSLAKIANDLGFAIWILFIVLTLGFAGLGATGNFSLSSEPTVFADSSDDLYLHTYLFAGIPNVATLESPNGKTMEIVFKSNYKPSSLTGNLIEDLDHNLANIIRLTRSNAIVAQIKFDGTVVRWRGAYDSNCRWFDGNPGLTVEGNLVGAAADGTWTITNSHNAAGTPAGVKLNIQGKSFDDVKTERQEIDECGDAGEPGNLVPVKTWNWHMQSPNSRYDTYLVGELPGILPNARTSQTNPQESLLSARYFSPVSTPVPINVQTGPSQITSFYSDNFDADLTIPSSGDLVGALATNYQYATASTRWIQFSPQGGAYYQSGGKMIGTKTSTGDLRSPLVLDGYVWNNYIAKYDTQSGPAPLGGRKVVGGFAVRFEDQLNYIEVKPFTYLSGLEDVWLTKVKSGLRINSDLIITYKKPTNGWPEGQYTIEALGNNYKVKVDGITYIEFEDTKSDFLTSRIGFAFVALSIPSPEVYWDNFRISRL